VVGSRPAAVFALHLGDVVTWVWGWTLPF